jgi:hypothetical protein
MDEMLAQYKQDRPFDVTIYRRKVIPGGRGVSLSAN